MTPHEPAGSFQIRGDATLDKAELQPPTTEPRQLVERASIRRNIAQMVTSQVLTWALATLVAVIVPRFLGPATLGELQLATALWAIVGVFAGLGTSMHLQLSISRDQRNSLAMLPTVFAARTIAFTIGALVLAGYLALIGADRTFVAIVVLSGAAALITLWADVLNSSFIGLERVGPSAVVNVATRLVLLLLTSGVLVAGFGVLAVVGVNVASTLVGSVALFVLFKRTLRGIAVSPRPGVFSELRPIVTASVPFMTVTLALMAYRQIDVIAISQLAGARDVGWYAAADLLAGSLFFPTTIVMSTAFPTFGRLHVHDPDHLRALVRRTHSLLLLAAVPIGFGTAVVGPSLAPLMFGDDFTGTGDVLVIFGPITILTFTNTLLGYLALATGRTRFLAWLIAGCAVVTIPLDMLLVPWAVDRYDNGAIGGAVAFVVTESLQLVIALSVVAPYLVTRTWAWRSGRVLMAGGIMVALIWPFRHEFFLIPVAIGAVVYPIAVWALRTVEDDQRALLADAVGRIGIPTGWIRQR